MPAANRMGKREEDGSEWEEAKDRVNIVGKKVIFSGVGPFVVCVCPGVLFKTRPLCLAVCELHAAASFAS